MTTRSGSEAAEEALAKLDAEEAKASKEAGENDTKDNAETAAKDAGDDKQESDKTAGKSGDEAVADDKKVDDKETSEKKGDEKEYTADDGIEVEEVSQEKAPEVPRDSAGIQLSPDEQKYIRENIGEPIVIRGIKGTGDDAKEVEIKAYSVADIPVDFHFTSEVQRLSAQNGFDSLERKAQELLGSFRQNQNKQAMASFEKRENEGIRQDVSDLQKEGYFPKFKIQPGQAGFDDDPAAKQMQEVLDVMTKANQQYLAEYNQGRPYRHIGFREAFERWDNANNRRKSQEDAKAAQSKEDEERDKTARSTHFESHGSSSLNIVKPTVRSGTTVQDIINRYELEQ